MDMSIFNVLAIGGAIPRFGERTWSGPNRSQVSWLHSDIAAWKWGYDVLRGL
jgi:hypothetical protein